MHAVSIHIYGYACPLAIAKRYLKDVAGRHASISYTGIIGWKKELRIILE